MPLSFFFFLEEIRNWVSIIVQGTGPDGGRWVPCGRAESRTQHKDLVPGSQVNSGTSGHTSPTSPSPTTPMHDTSFSFSNTSPCKPTTQNLTIIQPNFLTPSHEMRPSPFALLPHPSVLFPVALREVHPGHLWPRGFLLSPRLSL